MVNSAKYFFKIGQFVDDRNCSKLRTTLANFPPAHVTNQETQKINKKIIYLYIIFKVLYEKNGLIKETKLMVDMQNGIKESLVREKEMYGASSVLRMLTEEDYFKEKDEFNWPESFKPLLSER